jgi:hypothetical protein
MSALVSRKGGKGKPAGQESGDQGGKACLRNANRGPDRGAPDVAKPGQVGQDASLPDGDLILSSIG